MTKATETIELPAEGFALLIISAAQAIINHLQQTPAENINVIFLHDRVGALDELLGKFEILHRKEKDAES
jgi:hypothetical protein